MSLSLDQRIFESLKREITATSLPQHWNDALHTSSRWGTDAVIKHVIVYSRFNKYRSSGTQCVVTLFKAKVISRVNVEYQFARFQNTVCNFVERWHTYNVLCKVENDNIVSNL